MSNISFNFELNKRPNKKGKYSIVLRITEERKHKRHTTSVEISRVSDWNNKKQMIKNTAEYADKLNDELQKIMERAKDAYRNLKVDGMATSSTVLRRTIADAEKHILIDYCKERILELENNRQFGTSKKYGDTINKLECFLKIRKEKDLLINEVNREFIDKFTDYLLSLPNHRDSENRRTLSHNTICKHLKVLRALFNTAIERGYVKSNPLQGLSIKEETSSKRHLTNDEIRKLQTATFKEGSGLDNARNIFLLAYYCAGIRIGDAILLRWNNVISIDGQTRIDYTMTKTNKNRNLLLVDEAKAIIMRYKTKETKPDDYIFPYLSNSKPYAKYHTFADIRTMPKDLHKQLFDAVNSRESLINKQLKEVADMLDIVPAFDFHTARRSFAKQANISGINCLAIQDLLAHDSLSTTERYMRDIDTSANDTALEQIFSTDTKERKAKVLIRALMDLGYNKTDVKRLFDETQK